MVDLARTVTALRLDLGIAWDADGDRIGVVDHRGYRYEADWLVALLARPLLERRPGALILLDAKASRSAIEDVRRPRRASQASRRPATPRFRRRMREQGIAFGGETSGHIMFGPDYLGAEHYPWLDDGVYAACALLAWLDRSGQSLAEAASSIRPRPASPELRLPCPDADKAAVAAAIGDHFAARLAVDRSDGARIDFRDGWAHARPSNTAPMLSLRFEADSEAAYTRISEQLIAALETSSRGRGARADRRPTIDRPPAARLVGAVPNDPGHPAPAPNSATPVATCASVTSTADTSRDTPATASSACITARNLDQREHGPAQLVLLGFGRSNLNDRRGFRPLKRHIRFVARREPALGHGSHFSRCPHRRRVSRGPLLQRPVRPNSPQCRSASWSAAGQKA